MTGDGGKIPGIGGVLEVTVKGGVCLIPMATKFGAEFFGANSLTPVSGKLVPAPVLSSPELCGDGTLIGCDGGGGGGGGGGGAAALTLMNS